MTIHMQAMGHECGQPERFPADAYLLCTGQRATGEVVTETLGEVTCANCLWKMGER